MPYVAFNTVIHGIGKTVKWYLHTKNKQIKCLFYKLLS